MSIVTEPVRKKVAERFAKELVHPLQILLYHAQEEGQAEAYTDATREVLTTLAELSEGRLTVREVQLQADPAQAKQHGIDKVPALVFLDADGQDQNFRFFGAPVGYEFMALLDDIVDVSARQTRLSDAARREIKAITEDVVIQVFSTPG